MKLKQLKVNLKESWVEQNIEKESVYPIENMFNRKILYTKELLQKIKDTFKIKL